MKPFVAWCACALASGFFTSYPFSRWKLPNTQHTGAGFIGTLWGLGTVWLLPVVSWEKALLALIGIILVSVVISDVAEASMGKKDDSRIVIDEWAGYCCGAFLLPKTITLLLAAFFLFRVLDVTKPLWIRSASRLPGGWGVVVDDVLAGLVANVFIHVGLAVFHF